MKKFQVLVLILTSCSLAYAKPFANRYIEFELPPGWQCALEGSEYVCQSENKDRKKEAIMILAAKKRGAKDSLDEYQAYLKNKKAYQLPGGKTQVSESKYSKISTVNNHRWIDALHLASEVPGFYTRYLATVKEDLGIAVTFSVSKDKYNSYQPIFDSVISTMKVFRQKQGGLSDLRLQAQGQGSIEDTTFVPDDQLILGQKATASKERKSDGEEDLTLYIVALLGIVGYVIWKKKKKS